MATATIIGAWKDVAASNAYVAVSVAEGGSVGNVEYIAATPLNDTTGAAKSNATLKSDLTAALQAVRNAQRGTQAAIGALTGTVTL